MYCAICRVRVQSGDFVLETGEIPWLQGVQEVTARKSRRRKTDRKTEQGAGADSRRGNTTEKNFLTQGGHIIVRSDFYQAKAKTLARGLEAARFHLSTFSYRARLRFG